MAGFLGEDQIRKVKEAIDLVDIMGDYTTLKQSGTNFSGCCPFHHERTPSMYVYTDDQHYHCFGCGVHGDVISLVQEKEGLDFMAAMEWLARRAGIELQFEQKGGGERRSMPRSEQQRYLDIMEAATLFYEQELWGTGNGAEARAYLTERGLDEELCKTFRLGWAPGRDAMTRQLLDQGYRLDELQNLDVSVSNERGNADRFRQRLMFPICDRFGHVIAFSGRLLPAAEKDFKERGIGVGKYINSRDTPLYHKSNVVFNLHLARPAAREAGRIVVMEGPTDVMAAHAHGIRECVAVLGTALTNRHARLLNQSLGQEGRIILLFDGDAAGQKNSVKAVRTCIASGVPSQTAMVPDGHDPAELLAGEGAAGLEKVLQQRQNDIDHLLRHLAPRPYELDSRQQLLVIDSVLDVLRELRDDGLRHAFLDDCATYLNVEVLQLHRRLQEGQQRQRAPQVIYDEYDDYEEELPELQKELEHLLALLCTQPQLRDMAFDELGCEPNMFPRPWRQVVTELSLNHDLQQEGLLALELVVDYRQMRSEILKWFHQLPGGAAEAGELEEVMASLQRQRFDRQIKELHFHLNEAQRQGDHDRARELSQELFALSSQMRQVRGLETGQNGLE